jgi:hypothetical protein
MSRRDDHQGVTREAETMLRKQLEALVTSSPAPSPALAELLSTGVVPEVPTALPRRRKRRWLLALPLTVAVLGGTVGAASANVLPAPVQGVVSDTVGTFTPLHLPKKAHKPKPPHPSPGSKHGHPPGQQKVKQRGHATK